MDYFKRIVKHYLITALTASGAQINVDTHAELDAAMVDLEAHIEAQVNRQIKAHLVTLAQTLVPVPSDLERVKRGDRDVPCASCGKNVHPDLGWQPAVNDKVHCERCANRWLGTWS